MSGRWFRFYDGVVNDPKVQRLPPALFKLWVNLLCITSTNGGLLPGMTDMAFTLRVTKPQLASQIKQLVEVGLIEGDVETGLTPHNWAARQHNSDGAAERMRRHRLRNKTVTDRNGDAVTERNGDGDALRNGYANTVTVSTDSETDSETENPTRSPSLSHPEPAALPAAAPRGASACAAPASQAPSPAERVCEAMGVKLTEDAKRLNWPGQIAAVLANGLTIDDLIESAKAAKEREIPNISWVIKRAHGVKAEQRIASEQKASVEHGERVSQTEWRQRLTILFKGLPKTYADDPDDVDIPVGTWNSRWGPRPGEPGCRAPQKMIEEFQH